MTDPEPSTPDPRTDAYDDQDATNEGRSAQAPVEGDDDANPRQPGSPAG
jgi:hypothetical protein